MAVVLAALCGLGFLVSLVFLWGLPFLLYPWGDRQCQIHMNRCFCRSMKGWSEDTEEYEVGVCQVYDTLRHYAIALIALWVVGFIALVLVCIFHGLLQQRQTPTGSVGHQGPLDPSVGGHGFPEQGPYMANSKHFQLTKM